MSLEPVSVTARLQPLGHEEEGDELELAVRRFELLERIDHPWEATLELVSDDLDLDVRALSGVAASVELDRPGVTARSFGGVVTRAEYVTTRNKQLVARVVVEPALALLRYSRRRRIFSDATLMEVLDAVTEDIFATHGGDWDSSRISAALGPRDYVVQYDETDLEFVLRLLAQHGLCLLHGMGEGAWDCTYVLTDDNAMLPGYGFDASVIAESKPWEVAFVPTAEEEADTPSVQYLGRADRLHTQGVTTRARNWKTARARFYETRIELGDDPGRVGHVWCSHPSRLDEGKGSAGPHANETEAWARRELEEARASVEVSGASNVADFFAGATFSLEGHPHRDLDQAYAVLSVVHEADFPEVEHASASNAPTYTNRFVAAPLDAGPVRPPMVYKPRPRGIESARVVGPEGEEIHTDALGRVRVRFHWDDAPPAGAGQTCWLRVLSPWAGPGYGASFVPRVGMEVVVDFLGGDPDRPVVVGCLYTGTNTPPGTLPASKTCTVLRTQSSPGGEGFNELRFEDAAGSEEVYLHAQRNRRALVRAADSTRVGGPRSLSVGRDSTRTISGNETVRIGGDGDDTGNLEVVLTGGESRTVHEGHELTADSALWRLATTMYADAGDEVRVSCDGDGSVLTMDPKTAVLEARESIELRVGKTSLKLTPDRIELHGEVVTANAERQLWLAAPAGRVSLNTKGAEVFGGPKSESVLRMRAQTLDLKNPGGVLMAAGKAVTVSGQEVATVEASLAKLVGVRGGDVVVQGDKSVGILGANVDVHAKALVDVRGMPIHLNC